MGDPTPQHEVAIYDINLDAQTRLAPAARFFLLV
jgi:hypothetical protein